MGDTVSYSIMAYLPIFVGADSYNLAAGPSHPSHVCAEEPPAGKGTVLY